MKTLLTVAAIITALTATVILTPEDCLTDNGKKITGCQIVDGKAVYTK